MSLRHQTSPGLAVRHGRLGLIAALMLVSQMALSEPAPPGPHHTRIAAPLPPYEVQRLTFASAVDAAAQSPDGYLWFASDTGLYRFDGLHMDQWPARSRRQAAPSPLTGGIRRILVAADGALWVATSIGAMDMKANGPQGYWVSWPGGPPALLRIDRNGVRRFGDDQGLRNRRIWALLQHKDGTIWAGTEHGLCALPPGAQTFTCMGQGDGLPSDFVAALAQTPDGSLWAGTGAGTASLSPGAKRWVPSGDTTQVYALATAPLPVAGDRTGARVLVGVEDGVFFLDAGKPSPLVPAPGTRAVVLRRDGSVVMGATEGVLQWNGDVGGKPEVIAGTGAFGVRTVFEDREGTIFVGTSFGGLLRIQQRRSWIVPQTVDISNATFAVHAGRDGSMWMAIGQNIARWHANVLETFDIGHQLDIWSPRTLAEGPDGAIYVGAFTERLAVFNEGKAVARAPAGISEKNEGRRIHVSKNGDLWMALPGQELVQFEGAKLETPGRRFTREDGMCAGWVRGMTDTSDGTIWIGGGSGGISYVRDGKGDGKADCLRTQIGTSEVNVMALAADSRGDLWVAFDHERGLARIRPGDHSMQVIAPQALPTPTIFSILDDGKDHFWLSSAVGVFRVARADLEISLRDPGDSTPVSPIPALPFDTSEGLATQVGTSSFHPLSAMTPDGRVWVASLLGTGVIENPDRLPRTQTQPLIAGLAINGVDLDPTLTTDLTTPTGKADVAIVFSAPSTVTPHRILFDYTMEGADQGWVRTTVDRGAHYRSLSAGTYRFRLRAMRPDGSQLGDEVQATITVPPYPWQTWWFYLACTALLGGVVLTLHRLRVRRLHRQFQLLQDERSRLAANLHDHVAQGVAALGFHLDALDMSMDSKNANPGKFVGRARDVLGRFNVEIRNLIWDLREPGHRGDAFETAVERIVKDARLVTGVTLSLRTRIGSQSTDQTQELALIIKEAITNAIRHGKARNIEVAIDDVGDPAPDTLQITVTDDGVGLGETGATDGTLEPLAQPGHFGIVGMRERAQRMGGTFAISGLDSGGTRVTLQIPLSRNTRKPR